MGAYRLFDRIAAKRNTGGAELLISARSSMAPEITLGFGKKALYWSTVGLAAKAKQPSLPGIASVLGEPEPKSAPSSPWRFPSTAALAGVSLVISRLNTPMPKQSTSFKRWLHRASQQAWTSYETTVFPSFPYTRPTKRYEDDSVDIVYIATLHTFHKRDCLDVIRYKKHLLCGLPLAANAEEAEEVLVAARVQGVFIMKGGICICSRLSLCQHC